MKVSALFALLTIAGTHSAIASTQVVCTHQVAAQRPDQSVAGNYALSWTSKKAEAPHDWQAVGNVTPGGPYTFAKAAAAGPGGSHPVTMPAGNVCAIFRDGALDKADPFNVASGVASTGLPFNATHKMTW